MPPPPHCRGAAEAAAAVAPLQPPTGIWSAKTVLTPAQRLRYLLLLAALAGFLLWDYKVALALLNFAACAFYGFAVFYKARCVTASLFRPADLKVAPAEIAALPDAELPAYTVLVPLYKEANIAARLVTALGQLDYPPAKLDVQLLVEAEDTETASACRRASLPPHIRLVIVPDGQPRTKPRACNYGLGQARGELLVIYDAEDRPEPDQLKKAALAFRRLPPAVACVQAKLNYYNARQNWLTRFFALEYSVWFDLFLPGLTRLGGPLPLGGTSNHFRTGILRQLGGWDPYNVTEDCDLGIRLARKGDRTVVLDSTTWEEANSRLWNWVRQRSRWVKGYLQSHFVHTRGFLEPWRDLGLRGGVGFLTSVGGQVITQLLNPLYWGILIAWCLHPWQLIYLDRGADGRYGAWSVLSWVFFGIGLLLFLANFLLIGVNLVACARRRWWFLAPYALLAPFYWALISFAAWKGVLQLLWKPFYWEKTVHGLDGLPTASPADSAPAPTAAPGPAKLLPADETPR
ncbi:MAG: glycosyltransferase [Lentisphaeria bacterium]|jgi:cellulose synthase/poly-beta-1,6-N-acetylglucosamine synthase-like glycosyltransferase